MNILLVNHYAGSPELGMEFRPFYMARKWIDQGHQVHILAATRSHIRAHNPTIDVAMKVQVDQGVHYIWIDTPDYKGNGISRVKNIVHFLKQINKFSKRIQQISNPDLVIASSTYPADNYFARRIAKKSQALHFYEVHDLWPLSPIELGGMSKRHPFIQWMQMAENFAYRNADAVISMLPKTMEHMKAHGMAEEKWHYIPNGFVREDWENPQALNAITANEITAIRKQYKHLVAYTGTLGLANALDTFLDAAKSIDRQDTAFVLVGTGPEKERLLLRCKNENIQNVFILNSVPKTEMPSLLKEFDILYIGWLPHPIYRFGISPNKLIDYMMAAKPIIHAVKAANDFVKETNCGKSIPPENPQELCEAIHQLLQITSEERIEIGLRGRHYAEQNHDYDTLTKKFIEIAEGLR